MFKQPSKNSFLLPLFMALSLFSMLINALPVKANEEIVTDHPAIAAAFQRNNDSKEEVNTGQDFTKPLTRLDIRQKYQDLPDAKDGYTTTFRVDKPFVLNEAGWVLSLRTDLPLTVNDVVSRDNPRSAYKFGMSDLLNQFIVIAPQGKKKWTYGVGAQFIYPTASEDQMGTGRVQIAPLVGAKLSLSMITPGTFGYFLVRNHIDSGGYSGRAHQNYLVVQPGINFALPKTSFITIAPEMKMNYENNNNWFIPFDITIGKMLNKTTVVSLEYKTSIVDKNYPNYETEVEARIGFFF